MTFSRVGGEVPPARQAELRAEIGAEVEVGAEARLSVPEFAGSHVVDFSEELQRRGVRVGRLQQLRSESTRISAAGVQELIQPSGRRGSWLGQA